MKTHNGEGEDKMEEEVGLVEEQDRVHNREEVKEIRGGSSEEEIT